MKGSSGKAVQGSRFIIVKICIPDLFWGITLKKMMLKRELKDFPPQKQWGNIPNKVPGDIFIIHCKQVPTFQGHLLQEEMTWAEHASCLFLPGNERMRGNGVLKWGNTTGTVHKTWQLAGSVTEKQHCDVPGSSIHHWVGVDLSGRICRSAEPLSDLVWRSLNVLQALWLFPPLLIQRDFADS